VPGGSQWMFEVSTPDGKPWVSFKLPTQEVGNDELVTIKGGGHGQFTNAELEDAYQKIRAFLHSHGLLQ